MKCVFYDLNGAATERELVNPTDIVYLPSAGITPSLYYGTGNSLDIIQPSAITNRIFRRVAMAEDLAAYQEVKDLSDSIENARAYWNARQVAAEFKARHNVTPAQEVAIVGMMKMVQPLTGERPIDYMERLWSLLFPGDSTTSTNFVMTSQSTQSYGWTAPKFGVTPLLMPDRKQRESVPQPEPKNTSIPIDKPEKRLIRLKRRT